MEILLEIKDKNIILKIIHEKIIIDSIRWQDNRDLNVKLLLNMEKILRKNKLTFFDIKKTKVLTNIGKQFTTVRIAKATTMMINFLVQQKF